MDQPKVIHSKPILGEATAVSGPHYSTKAQTWVGDHNYELRRHISPNAPGGLDTLVSIERKIAPKLGELGETIPNTERMIAQIGVLTASQRGASETSSHMRSSVLLFDNAGKMAGNPFVVGGRAPDEIIRTVAQEVKAGALTAEHAAAVALGGARVASERAILTETPALAKALVEGAGRLKGLAESCLHHANDAEGLMETLRTLLGRVH
jgi:hypothetical protein